MIVLTMINDGGLSEFYLNIHLIPPFINNEQTRCAKSEYNYTSANKINCHKS